MSKRFREIVSVETIVDDLTGKRYVGIVDSAFIDLVNALYEDNQMLHKLIDKRDGWNNLAHERIFKLEKENEQLKKEIDCFKPLIFETDGKPITLYEKKDGDVE